MELRTVATLLLLCTAGTLAAPTGDGKCASECVQVYNQKFNYAPGKVYTYNYESSTTMSLPGSATETPGLKLKAVAEIHVISQCELVLKLTNVQLEGLSSAIPDAAVFKQAVEEKILPFSYTDGRVDHICPDAKEQIWALNIKRAVLSAFQNTMDNDLETYTREVDVIGQCDTHYTVTSNDKKATEVHKSKNVITCTHRLGNHTALQATPYVSKSDIQSAPVLNSSHECHHIFADNIIKSVVCEETHKLRIFAKGDHGTTTKTNTKLTFNKSGKSGLKLGSKKFQHSSLIFDHDEDEAVKADLQETTNTLKEICSKSSDGDIPQDAANRFTRLVYLVRRLPVSDLRNILQKLNSGSCPSPKAKDTFLSALTAAGSEASVQVVVDLLNEGKLTPFRKRLWLSSIAFIPHPTIGTIDALIPYVEANPHRVPVLALTTLAHSYCRNHPNCETESVIKKVIDKLGRALGSKGKSTNAAEEDRIIVALKAFGNLGYPGSYADAIVEIAKDATLPVPVRLAAIESFRRAPPTRTIGEGLISILEDAHQQVEVRIASYLGLVNYPHPKVIDKIRSILEVEVINQVNTFIFTHIKNLKETEDPLKQNLKWLVRNAQLQKKFARDPRKYSRNYERSIFNDRLNVGYTVDSNVIFSPESFLPRSASLNFSVDVFGSSFDLFEVDIRAEHFEHLLESYFGPTGSVTVAEKEDVRSKMVDRWRKISQGIENEVTGSTHSHRRKRELPYKPQKLKQLHEKVAYRQSTTPEGSMSLKIFGNELRYYSFHKLDDIYDKEDPYNLQDIFNKLASHKEIDVARNWMLVDSHFAVPTAMGIPLRLDLNATVSLGLKLNSHFDVRSLLLKPRACDIKSFIQPSANLELSAGLFIDAHVAKTGFKVASTFYTAPAVDGTVLLKQGESLTVKFDLPKPKFNLYNLKVRNYVIKGDSDIPITPVNTDRYEIAACSKKLADHLGLELCTKISAAKPLYSENRPHFPLSGDYEHDVTLKKVEEGLQGYHFTAKWKRDQNAANEVTNTEVTLSFNTPGSTKDREYTIDYQLDRSNRKLKAILHTPRNKVSLTGDFTDGSPNTKEGKLELNINDAQKYSFKGKTEVIKQGDTITYKPVWEITRPDHPKTTLVGTIVRTPGKRIEFDLKSDAASPKKVIVKGFAEHEGKISPTENFKSSTDFTIELPYLDVKFGGSFENHPEEGEEKHDLAFNGAYQLKPDGEKRGLSFKLTRETLLGSPLEYKIRRKIEWTTTRFPDYNGRVDVCVEKIDHEYHHLLDVKWGPNFEDANKKLFFEHTHTTKRLSRTSLEGQGSLKFIYPRRNINWDLKSKLQYQKQKMLDYELELKYAPDKSIKVSLDYKNQTTRFLKYDFALTIALPTREIVYRETVEQKSKGEYFGTAYVQWAKGEFVNLNTVYKNKGTTDVRHHEFDIVVNYKNQPKPLRHYNLVIHLEKGKYSVVGKAELPDITYSVDGQYIRPDPSNANLKLLVKLPWIEGQVKSKRTPNDFEGQFDFKTDKRAAAGSTTLKSVGTNKYNLATDLKWDIGRDDSKKLSLKANIIRPRDRAADVKATLDLPSRSIKANIKYELPDILFNGQHVVDLDVEYAAGKKVTIHADINVDKLAVGRRQSNGVVSFSSPSVEKVTVTYETDFRKITDQKSFHAKFKVDTVKFEDIAIEIDHTRGYKELKSSVEARYAGNRALRLGIGAFYDLAGNHGAPGFDVGGSIEIKTPLQGLQDFELTVREGYSRSYVFTHIVHENRVRWAPEKEAGLAFEWRRKYTPGEGFEVLQSFQLDTPLEHLRHQKLATDLTFHRSPNPNLSGNLDAIYADGKTLKSLVRYNREGPHIEAIFDADSSETPGKLHVTFSNEKTGEDTYLAKASGTYGEKTATIVNKLQWAPTKRSADLVITLPVSPQEITLKAIVNVQGAKRDVNVNVRWTPDGVATINGLVTIGDAGSFNGDLTVDSATLGMSGVKLNVRREAGGPKRAYGVKIAFGPEREFDASLNVNDKTDKSGSTGNGVLKINGENFITLKLDTVDAKTNKNSHGRLLSYSGEITNPVISFKANIDLLTEKGINPTIRICTLEGEKCLYLEALYDPQHLDIKLGPIDNNFYVKFGAQRAPGDSRTLGFFARTNQVRHIKEKSIKFAWDEEHSKYVGFSLKKEVSFDQKKPGSRKTYQIILPSRTIELRTSREESSGGYIYDAKFLLDSVRDPSRLLNVHVDAKNSSDGTTYTRKATVTIKHPDLSKELVITSEVKSRKDKFLYSRKLEFDLSSDARKKFTIDYAIADEAKSSDGHNYTLTFNLKQLTFKNLDFRIKGHSADFENEHTGGAEFYWLSKSGQPKTLSFFHQRDYANKHTYGVIRTPVRYFEWEGTYERLEDAGLPAMRSNLDFRYNGKLIRRAAVELSRRPEFNIKYFVDPADKTRLFRLHGGVLDDNTFRVTATRVRNGQETEDADILVKLNNTQLLFNRFKWRPGILSDLQQGIDARLDSISGEFDGVISNFVDTAKEEIADKTEAIRDVAKTELLPLASKLKEKLIKILGEVQNDLKGTKLEYLNDVLQNLLGNFIDVDSMMAHVEEARQRLQVVVAKSVLRLFEFLDKLLDRIKGFSTVLNDKLSQLPESVRQWRANLRAKLPEIAERIHAVLNRVRDFVSDIIENQYLTKFLEKFRTIWDELVGRVKGYIEAFLGNIFGSSDGKPSLYERIKTKLYEYSEKEGEAPKVVKGILTAIRTIKEKVQEIIADVKEACKKYREDLRDKFNDLQTQLDANPDYRALIEEIKAKRDELRAKYAKDDLTIKQRLRAYVDQALGVTRKHLQFFVDTYVFDLKGGRIEFYLPLPVPVTSLRHLRDAFNFRKIFANDRDSLVHKYHWYKPYLTQKPRDLLPPFEAHAMLVGNQHYMTFDKRFYDFAGKCQYVLTHDFADQNFSVIINYASGKPKPTKSSILIVSDSHHVEIRPDFKILLDEQEVELPVQIEHTVISQQWHNVRVDNNKGFTVSYDFAHDILSVNISGWYFGKVGGLLGTYNYEPSDDLRNPEGQNLTSVTLFANSWEVSSDCPTKDNLAIHAEAHTGTHGYDVCYKLFQSELSPFHECFHHLNPDNFYRICLEEIGINPDAELADNLCRASAAYHHACEHKNVHLEMPEKCIRCKTPSGELFVQGESHELRDAQIPKSADVVFVVEQKECNRRILLDSLDELTKDLEKELVSGGYQNNRYGIVGFGGEGVQQAPHSHTARGQVFTDARSVVLALKQMVFSASTPSDTFGAIDHATDYPFRTGVAKIAVLFLCSKCSEKAMSVSYPELQRRLLEGGFTIHALTPAEIEMKTKPQIAKQLIGIDAQTTYKLKDIGQKDLTGEADLRPHVTSSKDICLALAQELNGSVFRSDQLGVRKGNVGKNVKAIFARRAVQTAHQSKCQVCTCVPDADGVGKPFCRPCETPRPQNLHRLEDDEEETTQAPKKPSGRQTKKHHH